MCGGSSADVTLVLPLLVAAMFMGGALPLFVGVAFSTLAVGRDKDGHGGPDGGVSSLGALIPYT